VFKLSVTPWLRKNFTTEFPGVKKKGLTTEFHGVFSKQCYSVFKLSVTPWLEKNFTTKEYRWAQSLRRKY